MLWVDSSLACVLFDHDSLVFVLAHSGELREFDLSHVF